MGELFYDKSQPCIYLLWYLCTHFDLPKFYNRFFPFLSTLKEYIWQEGSKHWIYIHLLITRARYNVFISAAAIFVSICFPWFFRFLPMETNHLWWIKTVNRYLYTDLTNIWMLVCASGSLLCTHQLCVSVHRYIVVCLLGLFLY